MGAFWALVRKDLLLELRARELVPAMLLFAATELVILNFALDLDRQQGGTLAPGVLWVSLAFAGTLGLGRGFLVEKESGTLEALALSPVDRAWIYLARTASVALMMLVVEAFIFPLFFVLFGLWLLTPWMLFVAPLGTLGFAATGTLFGAMAAHTRAREMLLPLILLPVAVPALLGSVEATRDALAGGTAPGLPWTGLLAAFDALLLVGSCWLFEFVIEG